MNFLKSLRIHAYIKAITPVDDGGLVDVQLKLDYRNNVAGECYLRIWRSDAHHYYIGQELCVVPGKYGSHGCLRIDTRIEKISEPFANNQWVEIKLKLDERDDIHGDCYYRIWPEEAMDCCVGDEVCFVFSPLEAKT